MALHVRVRPVVHFFVEVGAGAGRGAKHNESERKESAVRPVAAAAAVLLLPPLSVCATPLPRPVEVIGAGSG